MVLQTILESRGIRAVVEILWNQINGIKLEENDKMRNNKTPSIVVTGSKGFVATFCLYDTVTCQTRCM